MRKVFWDNPYQITLTTKVASVNGNQLLFEETIIYSFSGAFYHIFLQFLNPVLPLYKLKKIKH